MPQSSSVNINSKHYSDHIDSSFINMVKALSIEFSLPIDPAAKEMGRCAIQDKMNSIIPPEAKAILKRFREATEGAISGTDNTIDTKEYTKLAYQVMKIMRIDNA